MIKMININNLEPGKRYWMDLTQTLSGIYEGVFAAASGDYVRFDNLIKSPKYMGLYGEKNNGVEFRANTGGQFPEYNIA
jgi:hypothetical protein